MGRSLLVLSRNAMTFARRALLAGAALAPATTHFDDKE
jgi:hypothetical protein